MEGSYAAADSRRVVPDLAMQALTLAMFVLTFNIAMLAHELAHAAFALAVTRGEVLVNVGVGPGAVVRIGRLALRICAVPLVGGYCRHDAAERRGDTALIAAAGPVASLFLAAAAWSMVPDRARSERRC
jgi:membrane-associated protease RseP (regulator of RpoE activity)